MLCFILFFKNKSWNMIDLQRINQFNDHCHNSEDKQHTKCLLYISNGGVIPRKMQSYTVFRHDTWLVSRAHYGSEYRKKRGGQEGERDGERKRGSKRRMEGGNISTTYKWLQLQGLWASLHKGIVTSAPLLTPPNTHNKLMRQTSSTPI